jgi:hypothetical protein
MKGSSRYVVLVCEECGERTVLDGGSRCGAWRTPPLDASAASGSP